MVCHLMDHQDSLSVMGFTRGGKYPKIPRVFTTPFGVVKGQYRPFFENKNQGFNKTSKKKKKLGFSLKPRFLFCYTPFFNAFTCSL
jgi:hypothetical protein